MLGTDRQRPTGPRDCIATWGALCLLLGLSGNVWATNFVWDSTWRAITSIYPNDDGLTFFVDGVQITPSACPNRLLVLKADQNYSTKIAALLTAYSQGKRLQVAYDNSNPSGCDTLINRFIIQN